MKEAANRGGLKCLLFFLRSHHVEAGRGNLFFHAALQHVALRLTTTEREAKPPVYYKGYAAKP